MKSMRFLTTPILFLSGWLLSLLLLPVAAAQSPQAPVLMPITVQVNWNHQFEFAGFYAAVKQGYYSDVGLDVEVKAWQPGIYGVDEVVKGNAHFATGYTSVIADYAKGAPISLVMTAFQFSPMVLLSHEPVVSLEQLSGKKVMHYGNMQVKALIHKSQSVVKEPVIEVSSTGNLQDFIDRKADFYAAYNTNEPHRLSKEGVPFYILDPKSYGIHSYGDLVITSQKMVREHPDVVAAFRDATVKGWQYAITHQAETVDFILSNYEVVKDREALLSEAAATQVYVQPGNSQIGAIDPVKLMASAVDARDVGLLSKAQFASLSIDDFLFKSSENQFTKEELQYLQTHPVIKIGNDSFWEPFEFIDESGKFSGMAADYFEIISKQLGVKFEPFTNMPWSEVMELVKQGQVPILSCAVATPERKQLMKFTKPYLSFPLVLVATEEVNFIDDYRQLNGQTVAVPEGYWSQEWLEKNYPEIDLLLVNSVKEGLQSVLNGKAVAYSGNLASINFAIKRYGLNGLHIAADSDARFELAIGVSKGDPILYSIMNKALNNISAEQKDAIYNKWIQLELVKKTDHRVLFSVITVSIIVLLLLVMIIYIFHRQKKRQDFYIKQVNELSMATYTTLPDLTVEWVSDSFLKLVGCDREQIVGQSHDVLRNPEIPDEFYEQIFKTVSAGKVWSGELKATSCAGHTYWVEATLTPEFKHGQPVGVWTTRTDITDKKRMEELAIKDSLTGVYNRNQFNELFETQVHKAGRNRSFFCMAMFDVDDFKLINDRYGHQRGDEVLKEVVSVTKQYFNRANDLIFRVGGEEFVILSDFESLDSFEDYLNQFREAVKSLKIPNPDSDLKLLTISIGGLFCEQMNPFIQSSQVYSRADKALYEAKHGGRNCVVLDPVDDICHFTGK